MFGAGIKKELKFLFRGFRFWGIVILILGVSLTYPLMYKMLESMTEVVSQISGEGGISGGEAVGGMMDGMTMLYGGYANMGFMSALSALSSLGFIVITIILMPIAGGEQKKRSVIIPNCSGLTPAGYVLPKFALYPLLIAVMTFLGSIGAGICSDFVFSDKLEMSQILFSSACVTGYILCMVSVYFLFGIGTGRPGIGIVVINIALELCPVIFGSLLKIDRFTPFALLQMLMTPLEEADMNNFTLSLIVCVIISVIACILSLVIMTVRKIDNRGTDANL